MVFTDSYVQEKLIYILITWRQTKQNMPENILLPYSIATFCRRMQFRKCSWWRHQMETFSALLAICAGNSPVPGEFPTQRPVTRSFDVFFDLRLNKRLSKQSWGWWFETPSWSLWRHVNVLPWRQQNEALECSLYWTKNKIETEIKWETVWRRHV